MAIRTFEVTSYLIRLGDKLSLATIQARGVISCRGADDQRVVAYFLAPDSPVVAARTAIGGKWGLVFLPVEMMPVWIDMLRHEKPLYGYINTDSPESTHVATTEEPVGEEEL